MRLVFNIISFLSLLAHTQSLRIFTVRALKSPRSSALFQASLKSFIDKNFEADWGACKRKLPDLNTILPQAAEFDYEYDSDDDELEKLVALLDNISCKDKFDVKIYCGDKSSKPLLAHSSILSDCSPVFKQFLSDQKAEGDFAVIELPDVDKEVGKELLHFMYSLDFSDVDSKVFKQKGMGEGLLRAALKYKVTDLVDFFDSVLAEQVDDDNAVALRLLAKRFELEELQDACKDHLDDDIDLVRKELKTYALKGIAGEEEQKAQGPTARPALALKESINGDVDEGEEEEDVTNEVDYDFGSDD